MYPSRPGGDAARGRPVGGPGDRAGLPGCAGAARLRPAGVAVAQARGSALHSTPAPGSRPHRWRTPSGTPPRGSAPCATARLWLSRRPAAAPAQGEDAPGRDGGDRPTGGRGRRRAARWAAITRTRIPTPSRSRARHPTGPARVGVKIAARAGVASGHGAPRGRARDRQPAGGPPPRAATPRAARAGAETAAAPRRPSAPARGAVARAAGAPAPGPAGPAARTPWWRCRRSNDCRLPRS